MEVVKEISNYAAVGISVANTIRDRQQFKEKERLEREQHDAAIKLAQRQHEEEKKLAKQIYLVDKFSEVEQHFQQLNADLLAAAKESERDMWDQRNQQFSNIVVATTIIMTGLITVSVQGILPAGLSEFILVSYAIANSMSMGLLVVCAVLCLEIVLRASNFMFLRTREYSKSVRNAVSKTEKIIHQIRYRKEYEDASLDRPKELKQRLFVGMSDEEIEREFQEHERDVRKYLKKRQTIIEEASELIYSDHADDSEPYSNSTKEPFSRYWRVYCDRYSHYAIIMFYTGSAFLVIATMICMWVYYAVNWDCLVAAQISVAIMSAALVICGLVLLYLRYGDRKYLAFKSTYQATKQEHSRRTHWPTNGLDVPGPDDRPHHSHHQHHHQRS